jgi:hypothetical protein
MVERVSTYDKRSAIQQPAADQVAGVRFPVRYFHSSSRLLYLKAFRITLTSAISRETSIVRTTAYQKLVLVSLTGYKTKNRVLHCLAPHFISWHMTKKTVPLPETLWYKNADDKQSPKVRQTTVTHHRQKATNLMSQKRSHSILTSTHIRSRQKNSPSLAFYQHHSPAALLVKLCVLTFKNHASYI